MDMWIILMVISNLWITNVASHSQLILYNVNPWECHNENRPSSIFGNPNIFRSNDERIKHLQSDVKIPDISDAGTRIIDCVQTGFLMCGFSDRCKYLLTINIQDIIHDTTNNSTVQSLVVVFETPFRFSKVYPIQSPVQLYFPETVEDIWLGGKSLNDLHIVDANIDHVCVNLNIQTLTDNITKMHINIPHLCEAALVRLIDFIGNQTGLTTLDFSSTKMNTTVYIPHVLKRLADKTIRTLILNGIDNSSDPFVIWDLEALSFQKVLDTLEYLDLSNNNIVFYKGIKLLQNASNLKVLDISGNQFIGINGYMDAGSIGDGGYLVYNLINSSQSLLLLFAEDGTYKCYLNRPCFNKAFFHTLNFPKTIHYNCICPAKGQICQQDDSGMLTLSELYTTDIYLVSPCFTTFCPTILQCMPKNVIQKFVIKPSPVVRLSFLNLSLIGATIPYLYGNLNRLTEINIRRLFLPSSSFSASEPIEHINANIALVTDFPDNINIFNTGGRSIKLDKSLCSLLKNLTNINLSSSQITQIFNATFQQCFFVTNVNISQNQLTFLPKNLFRNNLFLETVIVNSNSIWTLPDSIFSNCSNLKEVDFSSNNLTVISYRMFLNCKSLETINLAHNKINVLNFMIPNSVNILDMFNNEIGTIPLEIRNNLDYLGHNNNNFSLNLQRNELQCACDIDEILTVRWVQENNVNLENKYGLLCFGTSKSEHVMLVDTYTLERKCFPSYVTLIVSITLCNIIILFSIISGWLCSKYRYRIKTKFMRIRRNMYYKTNKAEGSETNRNHRFTYDAFLSYSASDRFWVHSTLVKILEDSYGFKLCVHYRDFPAGGDLADVIVDYMMRSEIIIVILSKYSLQRHWCDYEVKQAHAFHIRYNKPLLFIKMGEIPRSLQSGLLRSIFDSKIYINWPEEKQDVPTKDLNARRELFWQKVVDHFYVDKDTCCYSIFRRVRRNAALTHAEEANYSEGESDDDCLLSDPYDLENVEDR